MSAGPIETILCELLDHLEARFPGLDVEPFPDNSKDYSFKHEYGAILPRFVGSELEEETNGGQWDRAQFNVSLLTRHQLGEGGGYRILDQIRLALNGKKFGASRRCIRVASGFRRQTPRALEFDSLFEMSVWLPDEPENADEPLLKSTEMTEA